MEDQIEKENNRVQALKTYDLMDSPPEIELDEIIKIAYITCETPISCIALLDHSRCWLKSNHGLEYNEVSKDISFCNHTIQQHDLFIVEDSLLDDRFKTHPFVLGDPFIRFYAEMPLVTPSGYNIGTICIADRKPRNLCENQKFILKALAKQVITNFEFRKNNKELVKLNEKTQKLSDSKEEFFSNMSHELRTPLNAISGFTEILSKTKLDPKQKEQLDIIHSSVNILISIVNDILDYSKIDSGELKIENHPFNLRRVIKETHELLKLQAKKKNIEFIVNVNEKIPTYISGDKVRLNQILINLIGNAIKFTNSGSVKVDLDILNNYETDIEIYFSVKDTGIGIPSDKLSYIFDRFHQVKSNTRVYGGSGLGLSISKSLLELQNGKLEVKSTLGQGSQFSFSIKYKKSTQEEIEIKMNKESSDKYNHIQNLKNIRVLLAEDNIINIKLIQKIFEGTGVILDVSENGKICVEKLKQNTYDIILTDLNMPVMDGYETTRYIRNTLKLDIPILGLSANISELEEEKCIKEGMNCYIMKPFKADQLLKAISKLTKIVPFCDKSSLINEAHSPQLNAKRHSSANDSIILKKSHSENLFCVLSTENILGANYKKSKSFLESNSNILTIGEIKNPLQFENPSKTFNLKFLQDFSGNDKEFEKELIDLFIIEVPQFLEELEEEIRKEDFEAIRKTAHKIKSPLGVFGLLDLIDQLDNIEKLTAKSDIIQISKLFINCHKNLEIIITELKTLKYTLYKDL